MRYVTLALAALTMAACSSEPALFAREKLVDGMDIYCNRSQAVRMEIREWVNENSPHQARIDCEGDVTN